MLSQINASYYKNDYPFIISIRTTIISAIMLTNTTMTRTVKPLLQLQQIIVEVVVDVVFLK